MPKSKSRKKKSPKRALALPDLGQSKTAVLNSLTSASGRGPTSTRFASSSLGIALSRASPSIAPSFFVIGSTSSSCHADRDSRDNPSARRPPGVRQA